MEVQLVQICDALVDELGVLGVGNLLAVRFVVGRNPAANVDVLDLLCSS